MASKSPLDQTTRTVKFDGFGNDGKTVRFVEHHTIDADPEGITLYVVSKAQWKKDGVPTEYELAATAVPDEA